MRAHLRDVSPSRRIYCAKFLRIYQPTGKMRLGREITCNNCGRESIGARDDRWHSTWYDARPRRLAPFLKLGIGDLRKRGVDLRKGAILRGRWVWKGQRAGAEKAMVRRREGRRRGTVAAAGPSPSRGPPRPLPLCVQQVPHPCLARGYLLESTGYAKEREGASHVRQHSAE